MLTPESEVAALRPSQPIGVPLGLSIFSGLGIGGATQLSFIVVQYSIPQQLIGISVGALNTIRSVGGAVGVAIFNSILSTKQNSDLPGAIISAAQRAGASQDELSAILKATLAKSTAKIVKAANGDLDVVNAVLTAYKNTVADSYR